MRLEVRLDCAYGAQGTNFNPGINRGWNLLPALVLLPGYLGGLSIIGTLRS